MKDLTIEDFNRLVAEVAANTENAEEWAEKVGIDMDLLMAIGQTGASAVFSKMKEAVEEEFGEDDFEELLDGVPRLVSSVSSGDVGQLISAACINAFALGYESHKEFGSLK